MIGIVLFLLISEISGGLLDRSNVSIISMIIDYPPLSILIHSATNSSTKRSLVDHAVALF